MKTAGAGSARVYSEPLVETNRLAPTSGLGVCGRFILWIAENPAKMLPNTPILKLP